MMMVKGAHVSLLNICARGPAEGFQLKCRGNAMQCNRNMVRWAGRKNVHISPLFRLLLPVPYNIDWHRRLSDHVAVDVRFYVSAFKSSEVFKGLQIQERKTQKCLGMRLRYLILLWGRPRKHRTTYQSTILPAYAPRCRAVADGDSRGTLDGLGCMIPM